MRRFALALGVLLVPGALLAQTLADKVPASSFFYIGFKGSKALTKQYETSRLRPLLESTDLNVLTSENFINGMQGVIAREDDELAEAFPHFVNAAKQMWQYPTAFAICMDSDSKPGFRLVCEAGPDAPSITQTIKTGIAQADGLTVKQSGNFVVVGTRVDDLDGLLVGNQQASSQLAINSTNVFQDAIKHVDKDAAVTWVINVDAVISQASKMMPPDEAKRLETLGLTGMHAVAYSGNFDANHGWSTRMVITAPQPRKGITTLFEVKPLDDSVLKLVPMSAMHASIGQMDLAALVDELIRIDEEIAPGQGNVRSGLQNLNALLNMDVRQQILPVLGPEWVMYSDANIGGTQFLGTVLANRLRDPAKADAVLRQLETKLMTYARAGAEMKGMKIPLVQRKYGQLNVRTINLPIVSPSWTVRDGVLYIGLYPQVVIAAAEFAGSGKQTINDLPQMAQWRKSTGGNPAGLRYTDLPQAAGNGYGLSLLISRYLGLIDLTTGIQTPSMPVPPLPLFRQHTGAELEFAWSDATGYHVQSAGAFPGSAAMGSVLSSDVFAVQGPLMASIMLPSLARAREAANRVKCASNLRQIGMGMHMFAAEHNGDFPPDLGTLETVSPEVFLCPNSHSSVPDDLRTAAPAHKAEWVNNYSDYQYVGAGLKNNSPPGTVVAYESADDHGGEGANVLYADGHVEFVPAHRLEQELKGQGR